MAIDVLERDDLPFPHSLPQFQRLFPDEAACAAYLERTRWSDGLSVRTVGRLTRHGTFPHALGCFAAVIAAATPALPPVPSWSARIRRSRYGSGRYLVASQTPGISAIPVSAAARIVALYETAFHILHKLRVGMVRPDQDRIGGNPGEHVEADETWVGGRTRGEGRGVHHKTLVAAAVEVRQRKSRTKLNARRSGRYAGRFRLALVPDRSAEALCGFVKRVVAPGARSSRMIGAAMTTCQSRNGVIRRLPKSSCPLSISYFPTSKLGCVVSIMASARSTYRRT